MPKFILLLFISLVPWAQAQSKYQTPTKVLADLVDAPRLPTLLPTPDDRWAALLYRAELPQLSELAKPEVRLAGLRINPATFANNGGWSLREITLLNLSDGTEHPITGLPDTGILAAAWSPDSQKLAISIEEATGVSLWVVNVTDKLARRVGSFYLNACVQNNPFSWMADSQSLVALIRPSHLSKAPERPIVPEGPTVQETSGKKASIRTFQDMLSSPYDETLFDYYLTAQIGLIQLNGEVKLVGEPSNHIVVSPSPDGQHLLVDGLKRPYSYLVPFAYFPWETKVLDLTGKLEYQVADLPLAENIPKGFGATRTGPRAVHWRSDAAATVFWVEALDGGDPKTKADLRDRLSMLAAPFDGKPVVLASLANRFRQITWGNEKLALIEESWWATRNEKTWILDPSKPGQIVNLFDRSSEDSYTDPGQPLTTTHASGTRVLQIAKDGSLYFAGQGASPEGNIPFLDKISLKTKKSQRLWRSEAPFYERVLGFLNNKAEKMVTIQQSRETPANYIVRDLKNKTYFLSLTHMKDPAPAYMGIQKELITYPRADGVSLSGTLYLPPGYKPADGPLPTLLWAYPQEFKSSEAAGQVRNSPYEFSYISPTGALPYLALGYAVLDDPAMPIVGEKEAEPNDTYVPQLVASAKAAIDELVRRGVTDPSRVAVGGHSYGAFMVANLLAHSDLFRTGIARSGAYNRTLTPFGFQAEERNFWEATEVYNGMSPFFHADKINEPLLLIHGETDNNPGTFLLQSQRLFQAVKGLGGKAKLVTLPHESHGYKARESWLHLLWEQGQWLDTYLKQGPDAAAATPKPTN